MAQPRERTTEEEEALEMEPRTPVPAPSGGAGMCDDSSPDEGSTPGSGAELTRRDLQRVKSRFVNMNEYLRDSITEAREALSQTRTEFWEAIEDVGQERAQFVPMFQRLLDTRSEMLASAFQAGLTALKEELNDFVTPLQARVDILQSTVERVAASAQRAMEELNQAQSAASPDGSKWPLADCEDFQEIRNRVEGLEVGAPRGPAIGTETQEELHQALEERVSYIESFLRVENTGHTHRPVVTSILDSMFIAGLSPLTDDKSAFRQWDAKIVNALTHARPGYRKSIENMKEIIDKGQDPEESRGGASPERLAAVSGAYLADIVSSASGRDEAEDIEQLGSDLSFLLIDIAQIGSDILRRIQKGESHGEIRMYVEVYKSFTETSGLGLMEQATRLMTPKRATKEELVAEAIGLWEENVNRIARHGEEYQLNDAFKHVALMKILTGKTLDHFDIWQTERLSFDDLLRRVT